MKATLKNLETIFNFINENHAANYSGGADFAMFDDESTIIGAVEYAVEQLKDEPMYLCNSCHEFCTREEMDFDVDEDQDLCKNCNYQSFNDSPYGENN
ncbi:MAG: hypothetical protein GTO02_19495 [Candidatus Dadabacteria bacterium]|nr:hypothetical protein [Candidatus Dadabacteria bacterium]